MRRYAMTMTMSAVSVAVLLLGLPLGGAWIASALRSAGSGDRVIIIGTVILTVLVLTGTALTAASVVASRVSRRISAPLIYLAAEAEQLGSGQVRRGCAPRGSRRSTWSRPSSCARPSAWPDALPPSGSRLRRLPPAAHTADQPVAAPGGDRAARRRGGGASRGSCLPGAGREAHRRRRGPAQGLAPQRRWDHGGSSPQGHLRSAARGVGTGLRAGRTHHHLLRRDQPPGPGHTRVPWPRYWPLSSRTPCATGPERPR